MTTTFTRAAALLAAGAFAAASFAGAAVAKPDKPINAAETEKGQGCVVRDADGNYHLDEACEYRLVIKFDKDGNLQNFSYQDKGTLPEDAPHPDKADKVDAVFPLALLGLGDFECTGMENTKPSGEYSSNCKYNANAAE